MANSLHEAARKGDADAVREALLQDPHSLNSRDHHSRTALHLAAWSGHTEVVKVLCDKDADVGASASDDMAAIHFACQKGHLQVARLLLASGAFINARTRKGMTPLHYAVQGNHVELAKLLIRKGANVTAETKAGKKPFDLAKDADVVNVLQAEVPEQKKRTVKTSGLESQESHRVLRKRKELDQLGEGIENTDKSTEANESLKVVNESTAANKKSNPVMLSHLLNEDADEEG